METFQIHLDAILSNLFWGTCFSRGLDEMIPEAPFQPPPVWDSVALSLFPVTKDRRDSRAPAPRPLVAASAHGPAGAHHPGAPSGLRLTAHPWRTVSLGPVLQAVPPGRAVLAAVRWLMAVAEAHQLGECPVQKQDGWRAPGCGTGAARGCRLQCGAGEDAPGLIPVVTYQQPGGHCKALVQNHPQK